jgi:hypothetical protein
MELTRFKPNTAAISLRKEVVPLSNEETNERELGSRLPINLVDRIRSRVVRHTPAKLSRVKLSRSIVSFMFDDFPKSAWEVGGPIFASYNALATYYVAGSLCGCVREGVNLFDKEDVFFAHAAGREIGGIPMDICISVEHHHTNTLKTWSRTSSSFARSFPR